MSLFDKAYDTPPVVLVLDEWLYALQEVKPEYPCHSPEMERLESYKPRGT